MGRWAILMESYLFPAFFLYSVYNHLRFFARHWAQFGPALQNLSTRHWSVAAQTLLCAGVAKAFLVLLNILIVYGLIARRNLKRGPQGFQEFAVPLLGTFFYLLYNFAGYLPGSNTRLVPADWLGVFGLIGSLFNIAGAAVSLTATYNLRHSYGLFVQVRDIITQGLYRHVRHPIYFGYTLSTIGFMFLLPNPAYWTVFILSFLTTVYRARLEEKKLLAFSPEYRAYAQKTPFLFPLRFFR